MAGLKGRDLKYSWKSFIKSKGEDDFYTIYSHYHHYLSFIGHKRYFSADVVKDSINDVFLYLWENRSSLEKVSDFHTYIITCFLRKLYRKRLISPNELYSIQDVQDEQLSPSVEEEYIQHGVDGTVKRIVKDHVGQLAVKQRRMVYQKYYLGLSYKEIAVSNKVSIHTVYNTIYKAIDKIKSAITKEQEVYLLLSRGTMVLFVLFFQFQ